MTVCLDLTTQGLLNSLSLNASPEPPTGFPSLSAAETFGNPPRCAQCARPCSYELCCERCKVTDVGQLRVLYCSEACRDKHGPVHATVCDRRRQLARVTSMLDELWTNFEKSTAYQNIRYVGETSSGIVRLAKICGGVDPRGWTGGFVFRKFHGDVLPRKVSDKIARAVLFDQNCDEVGYTGEPLIRVLLQPLCSRVEEVTGPTKNRALHTSLPGESDRVLDGHSVLRATLPTNETFAIDLTGAQYGWTELLYPWKVFENHRLTSVEYSWAPGSGPMSILHNSRGGVLGDCDSLRLRAVFDIRQSLAKEYAASITSFLGGEEMSLPQLVSEPDESFATLRARLVKGAKAVLRGSLEKMQSQGIGRMYFDEDFQLHVARDAATAAKYKSIWFSDKEMRAHDGNVAAMMKLWKKKTSKANAKGKAKTKAE